MKLTKQERERLIEEQENLLKDKSFILNDPWEDEFDKYFKVLGLQHKIDIIDIKLSK